MSAKGKLNDSAARCHSLVCTSPPLSLPKMGEPEVSSISFQESLRFFQEQLLINSSSAKSSEAHVRCGVRSNHGKQQQQHYSSSESLTLTEESSDNSSSCSSTSIKITPIPTVETILESVRILRAIQRSQAQRNPLWTKEEKDGGRNELRTFNSQDECDSCLQRKRNFCDSIERCEIDLLTNIDNGCSCHVLTTATEQRPTEVQTERSQHELRPISRSEEMLIDSAVGSECASPTRSGSSKSDDNEACSFEADAPIASVFQEGDTVEDAEERVLNGLSIGYEKENETCPFWPMNQIGIEKAEGMSLEKDYLSSSQVKDEDSDHHHHHLSAESSQKDCDDFAFVNSLKNDLLQIQSTSATEQENFTASANSFPELLMQDCNQTKTEESKNDADLRVSPNSAQNDGEEVSEKLSFLSPKGEAKGSSCEGEEEEDPNVHSTDDFLGNVRNSSSVLDEWREDEESLSESNCHALHEISAEEESDDLQSLDVFDDDSGLESLMKPTATDSSHEASEDHHHHLSGDSTQESCNVSETVDFPKSGCEGRNPFELPDENSSTPMDRILSDPDAQAPLEVLETIFISSASFEAPKKDTSYHEPVKLPENELCPQTVEMSIRLIRAEEDPDDGKRTTQSKLDSIPPGDSNEQKVTEFIVQHDTVIDYSSFGRPSPWSERSKGDGEERNERSQSALDSGIGMDKSVTGSSPVSTTTEESEKGLWSDATSTIYDSAEDSPFVSLTDVTEVSLISEDTEEGECKLGSSSNTVSSKKNEQSIYAVSSQHSIDVYGSNMDDTDVDFDNCSSSLGDMDSASLPELSEDKDNIQSSTYHHMEREDSPKPSDDIQNDRLLEIIEDSIHQLELQQTNQAKNLVSEAHFTISKPEMTYYRDVNSVKQEIQHIESNESKPEDETVKINDTIIKVDLAANEQINQILSHKTEVTSHDVECIPSKLQNETDLKDNAINLHFQCPDSKVVNNVDKTKCTEQVLFHKVDDDNQETENSRPKKNLTSSWNPTALLEHLYRIEKCTMQKDSNIQRDNLDGYVNILPLGTFSTKHGQFYVSVNNGSLSCYETEECEKPIFEFSLRNGVVEAKDNELIIDNRCGRCVHMKFAFDQELILWQTTLNLHCVPLSSKYLEPVHYPLKCHKDVIIVDLGSCSTRAGILMDQPTLPTVFFPTVCATDKITGNRVYGMEALLPEVRQSSVLSFPVRPSAKVTKFTMDISALEGLFKEVFCKLNVDPKSYTVQVCIPRSLSIHTQVALAKMLLEDFGVKAISLTRQALLTLYAHNTATAIVVDIGDRMDILPVVDGFIVENGVTRLPYGGQRIIHHMKHALAEKHISLSNEVESFVVQYVMESLCYIAEDYESEIQYATTIPEGIKKSIPLYPFFQGDNVLQTVTLDCGRFQVPEGLFNPDLWGVDFPGIHKLIHHAIQVSGVDVRRRIAENIIVSGGVTLLPGFVERLQAEVSKLTLPRIRPQIHASPYRYHMAYLGACKLSGSDAFPQVCVTAEEWNREGSSCMRKWHL